MRKFTAGRGEGGERAEFAKEIMSGPECSVFVSDAALVPICCFSLRCCHVYHLLLVQPDLRSPQRCTFYNGENEIIAERSWEPDSISWVLGEESFEMEKRLDEKSWWDGIYKATHAKGEIKGSSKCQSSLRGGFMPLGELGLGFPGWEDLKDQVTRGSCGRIVALPVTKAEL